MSVRIWSVCWLIGGLGAQQAVGAPPGPLAPARLGELVRQLDAPDGSVRLLAAVTLRRHLADDALREPLLAVVAGGGEGRVLALHLLAAMPAPREPLPSAHSSPLPQGRRPADVPTPHTRPDRPVIDRGSQSVEQLLEECSTTESIDGRRAAAAELTRRVVVGALPVATLGAAIERSPVLAREATLQGFAQHRGPWVRELFPVLRPYLRTKLSWNVLNLLHGDPALTADLVPQIVEEMCDASDLDVASLCWYAQSEPAIRLALLPLATARLARADSGNRHRILGSWKELEQVGDEQRAALRACVLAGESNTQTRAHLFGLAVLWGFDDPALVAAAAAERPDERRPEAWLTAQLLLQSNAAAPDPQLLVAALRSNEEIVVLAACERIARDGAPVSPGVEGAVKVQLGSHYPAIGQAAMRVAVRAGGGLMQHMLANPMWRQRLQGPHGETILHGVYARGAEGWRALQQAMFEGWDPSIVAFVHAHVPPDSPLLLGVAARASAGPAGRVPHAVAALPDGAPLRRACEAPLEWLLTSLRGPGAAGLLQHGDLLVDVVRPVVSSIRESGTGGDLVTRIMAAVEAQPELGDALARALTRGPRWQFDAELAAGMAQIWVTGSASMRELAAAMVRTADQRMREVGPLPLATANVRLSSAVQFVRLKAIESLFQRGHGEAAHRALEQELQRGLDAADELYEALQRSPSWRGPIRHAVWSRLLAVGSPALSRACRDAGDGTPEGDAFLTDAFAHESLRDQIVSHAHGRRRVPPPLVDTFLQLALQPAGPLGHAARQALFRDHDVVARTPALAPLVWLAWQQERDPRARAELLPLLQSQTPDLGTARAEVEAMAESQSIDIRHAALYALAGAAPSEPLLDAWRAECRRIGGPSADTFCWHFLGKWRGDLPAGIWPELAPHRLSPACLEGAASAVPRLLPQLDAAASKRLLSELAHCALSAPADSAAAGAAIDSLVQLGQPGRDALAEGFVRSIGVWSGWLGVHHPDLWREWVRGSSQPLRIALLDGWTGPATPWLPQVCGELLGDPKLVVQCAAVRALRWADPPPAATVLEWARGHRGEPLVLATLAAWQSAGAPFTDHLTTEILALPPGQRENCVAHLAALGRSGVPGLIRLAMSGVRIDATVKQLLGGRDDQTVMSGLMLVQQLQCFDMLQGFVSTGRSPQVRELHATICLDGDLQPAARDPVTLMLGLQSPVARVRRKALAGIASSNDYPAVADGLWVELCSDPEPAVRLACAAVAKARLDGDTLRKVALRMAGDPDAAVREAFAPLAR